jgi:glycine cleavage system H lipoate-binding protein
LSTREVAANFSLHKQAYIVLDELGAVESVKSASDIYSPVSGQIFEVNEELTARPNLINKSAENDGNIIPQEKVFSSCVGWICKIAVTESEKELDSLLTEEEYNKFLVAQHDQEMPEEAEPQNDRKTS